MLGMWRTELHMGTKVLSGTINHHSWDHHPGLSKDGDAQQSAIPPVASPGSKHGGLSVSNGVAGSCTIRAM